ncbi:TonB-dependent receptor [Kordiimonas lacus]|uniref:Iron complex outermembrane recepter protein n=1 Tax=Kordiimonas lacus TaxID=637679 RepID=A0A1G7A5K5_9PROT|nr:TonB-dependent receptor [Kordiimonas lacus]SDE10082.1 iron complex outermembrane recepter protein [Kordiimonas lacus]
MRTSKFKSHFLSFASASAIAFAAQPVLAQDSSSDTDEDEGVQLEEIVVTGIRASIMSSVARKRESSSIVEAISAEDLGKLPDASIAESIARLPGLAAQRLDGRANVISIRGLAPDFTTTTLNGREQVSANNGRAVEYDQYPSELINGVTIYKTPDASLTSQAVGGTVDLQTIKPLAYGEQAIVVNLRGEYADLGALNSGTTALGYRASISYVDQFNDDQVGIALGYARMLSPTQEERWNSWGFPEAADGNLIIGGAKPYVKSNELTRDGFLGVLEYAPHDSKFRTTIDAYYSKFDDEQTLRGIEIPLAWSGAQLQDGYTVEDGLITQGQFNGAEVVVRNDFVNREAETLAIGWNTEYQVNDNLMIELDLSHSSVDRIESNMETYAGTGRGSGNGATDNLGFTIGADGNAVFTHGLDYSDPNLIQLGGPLSWGWGLFVAGFYPDDQAQDGFINAPETDDELSAVRLSAEQFMDEGFLSSVEYGVRFSKRSKTLLDQGFFLTLNEYPADVPVPSQFLEDPTSLEFIGMGDVLSYDAQALFESGAYVINDEAASTQSRLTNSWTVTEKVVNLYAQANIDTELGNLPVTGNVGLQAVYTDQSSDGWAAKTVDNQVVAAPVTEGTDYWDFLPSLNLSFNLDDNNKLRVGVAQVLARAPMADMNAGFGFGFDQQNLIFTGGGGNPNLKPFKTWQYDLSYEHYFGEGAYVSVAGFYKQITSFPFSSSETYDFAEVLGPLGEDLTFVDGDGNEFTLSTIGRRDFKDNVDGGKIYGIELSGSLPFANFSEALDGFGILGSASFTKSSIIDPNSQEKITLPGLSKTVLNGTIYYEKYGFQARASVRHRSSFLGEVSALSLTRVKVDVEAETIVDAQLGYDLSEVGVDGLTVLFQVNNLTNEPFTTFYNGDSRQVRDFQNYGRTFLFGLNYKF